MYPRHYISSPLIMFPPPFLAHFHHSPPYFLPSTPPPLYSPSPPVSPFLISLFFTPPLKPLLLPLPPPNLM